MNLPRKSFVVRYSVALLLFSGLVYLPARVGAATASNEIGIHLLQAQLPAGTSIPQTTCEQLARAVGRATLTHRPDAAAILTAALTNGVAKDARPTEGKRPCACVTHIFRISLAAAPAQASVLLETASALYPDCADAFAAAVDHNDDKNVADDKNGPSRKHPAPSGVKTDPNGYGDVGPGDPSFNDGLTDRDNSGLGFGSGFGPGFPGSPGFTGSPPSGGIALPIPVPVTSVVNG